MALLLLFAFLAGILTILAPCVWPLLPVIFSTQTLGASRKRSLGILIGTVASFGVLTLSAAYIERSLGISENLLRDISAIILVAIGLLLITPPLTVKFETAISGFISRFGSLKPKNADGMGNGLAVGISLGILWTPCSGPIFAAIATQAGTEKVTWKIFLVTLWYLAGISIPLSLFIFGGERLISKSRQLNRNLGKIQVVSGFVVIVYAIATLTGYAAKWDNSLTSSLSGYSNILTAPERSSAVTNQLNHLRPNGGVVTSTQGDTSSLFNAPAHNPAPDFVGISSWINSKPLTMTQLKRHVVLLDFWTYTCINCIRSLDYVKKWYGEYQKDGLVVVGVSSPEFPFEADRNNVIAATKRLGITYPIAQDNNLQTWNAYSNEYWPAEYLIDAQGNIRRADFGEGSYDQMELAIQALLRQNGKQVSQSVSDPLNFLYSQNLSLETYLGAYRESTQQNPYQTYNQGVQTFTLPKNQSISTFALGGKWKIDNLDIASYPGAVINYNFDAHQVYIILRPHVAGATDSVSVALNGKPLIGANAGTDLVNGKISVNTDRLYNIFDSKSALTNGTLTLTFNNVGTQAYTFTFG